MLLVPVTGKILTLATHIQPCLTSAASFSVSVFDMRGKTALFPSHVLFLLGHKLVSGQVFMTGFCQDAV